MSGGAVDLAQIREDLAVVMQSVGFNTFSYVMQEPGSYPAAFAGIPTSFERLSLGRWKLRLPLTMLFSIADPADAQRRLDDALSPGKAGSVYDAIQYADQTGMASWTSVAWVAGRNPREVTIGKTMAFAYDIDLEITA